MGDKSDKHKRIHLITGAIFCLIGILHALRLIYRIPAIFGNWNVPMWVSWVALIVAGYFAVLLWKSK